MVTTRTIPQHNNWLLGEKIYAVEHWKCETCGNVQNLLCKWPKMWAPRLNLLAVGRVCEARTFSERMMLSGILQAVAASWSAQPMKHWSIMRTSLAYRYCMILQWSIWTWRCNKELHPMRSKILEAVPVAIYDTIQFCNSHPHVITEIWRCFFCMCDYNCHDSFTNLSSRDIKGLAASGVETAAAKVELAKVSNKRTY